MATLPKGPKKYPKIDPKKMAAKMARLGDANYEKVATNASKHTLYFVDTGNYMLNAQFSGSIWGGYHGGMANGVAGETQSGKSRLGMEAMNMFLEANSHAQGIYIDTEYAVDKEEFFDQSRVVLIQNNIIDPIEVSLVKKLNELIDAGAYDQQFKTFIVIDSLGAMIPAYIEDNDKDVKADMGRAAKAKKAMFLRILNKIHRAYACVFIANHVYSNIGGMSKMKEIAGGGGMKYCAQNLSILTTLKNDDDADNSRTIRSYLWKGRNVPPFTKVHMTLHFKKGGFQRYSGMFEFCMEVGLLQKWVNPKTGKLSTQYVQVTNTEKHAERKAIEENAEEFFDETFLKEVDKKTKLYFSFSNPAAQNLEQKVEKELANEK